MSVVSARIADQPQTIPNPTDAATERQDGFAIDATNTLTHNGAPVKTRLVLSPLQKAWGVAVLGLALVAAGSSLHSTTNPPDTPQQPSPPSQGGPMGGPQGGPQGGPMGSGGPMGQGGPGFDSGGPPGNPFSAKTGDDIWSTAMPGMGGPGMGGPGMSGPNGGFAMDGPPGGPPSSGGPGGYTGTFGAPPGPGYGGPGGQPPSYGGPPSAPSGAMPGLEGMMPPGGMSGG